MCLAICLVPDLCLRAGGSLSRREAPEACRSAPRGVSWFCTGWRPGAGAGETWGTVRCPENCEGAGGHLVTDKSHGEQIFHQQYTMRVSDQNGVSQLYNMLEIYHSGLEPSIISRVMQESNFLQRSLQTCPNMPTQGSDNIPPPPSPLLLSLSPFQNLSFFYVPQLDIWVSPFWVRFSHMSPFLFFFLNPTTEVVTFRLRGWCMLGVFLFLACTSPRYERHDLLNPCDGMHVCTD